MTPSASAATNTWANYRTLLGHFGEIGHYYWDRLILSTPHLDEFRRIFGDERQIMPLPCRTIMRAVRLPIGRSVLFRLRSLTPGRICRNLGTLFPHDRYAGNRACHWPGGQSKLPRTGAVFDFNPRDTDVTA
jgi:hypothetical protein